MRTGDVVKHKPSGEIWMVAWADQHNVYPCGWPDSCANLSDCELVEACTDEQHLKLLKEVADGVPERLSGRAAKHALEALNA